MSITWVELSNGLWIARDPVDRAYWEEVVTKVTSIAVPEVAFADAPTPASYGIFPGDEGSSEYDAAVQAFVTAAQAYAVGVSWWEAALWCNAASVYLGLDPVYGYDGKMIAALDAAQVRKHQLNIFVPDKTANGIRLPSLSEWTKYVNKGTVVAVRGLLEWVQDDGRTGVHIAEKMVAAEDGSTQCNMYFRLPCGTFRVMRGKEK